MPAGRDPNERWLDPAPILRTLMAQARRRRGRGSSGRTCPDPLAGCDGTAAPAAAPSYAKQIEIEHTGAATGRPRRPPLPLWPLGTQAALLPGNRSGAARAPSLPRGRDRAPVSAAPLYLPRPPTTPPPEGPPQGPIGSGPMEDPPARPPAALLLYRRAPPRPVHDRCVIAFNKLTHEQAERLADMFNEDVLLYGPDIKRMKEVTGESLTDSDLVSIAMLFLDLVMAKMNAALRDDVEDDEELDPDKRPLLISIAKRLRDAVDVGKLEKNLMTFTDQMIADARRGKTQIRTKFTPLASGEAAKRLIPHLVVETVAREDEHAEYLPVKFQLDIAGARELADDLQRGIERLEWEIKDKRKRFGDVVVHD